jgi:hypothetical protein
MSFQHASSTSLEIPLIVEEYVFDYFAHIVVVALLSLITIFRREMSCNSVYLGVDKMPGDSRKQSDAKSQEQHLSTVQEGRHSLKFNQRSSNKSRHQLEQHSLHTLPQEIQIKCLTYLHPKDILTLSCTDRQFNELIHKEIDGRSMSSMIWCALFQRDYARVLTKYQYGQVAVKRSMEYGELCCPRPVFSQILSNMSHSKIVSDNNVPTMKDFYFTFGQTWQGYILAGNPTLVGIHGHIFDMTSFLESHPGSPETIIMQGGGKDATRIFESLGHSTVARSIAVHKLLQVVDASCCKGKDGNRDGYGILTGTAAKSSIGIIPNVRSKASLPGTTAKLRRSLVVDQTLAYEKLRPQMTNRVDADKWAQLNVYFDPMCNSWKGWYLNTSFEPVFI